MFYVIQTNTGLNQNNQGVDFQSLVYKVNDKTWEEFKECILNPLKNFEIVRGTMIGKSKRNKDRIKDVIINDEFHLEVTFYNNNWFEENSKFYKVEKEMIEILLYNKIQERNKNV